MENIEQMDNTEIFPIKLNLQALQEESQKFVNDKYFGMVKLESQKEGAKEY